jgi:hypothetical protein
MLESAAEIKHERHKFERMLRKENELEKRKRRNRTFGGIDEGTFDSIDTISEDSEENMRIDLERKQMEEKK